MSTLSTYTQIAGDTIKRGFTQARFYVASSVSWFVAQPPLIIAAIITAAVTVIGLIIYLFTRKSPKSKAGETNKPNAQLMKLKKVETKQKNTHSNAPSNTAPESPKPQLENTPSNSAQSTQKNELVLKMEWQSFRDSNPHIENASTVRSTIVNNGIFMTPLANVVIDDEAMSHLISISSQRFKFEDLSPETICSNPIKYTGEYQITEAYANTFLDSVDTYVNGRIFSIHSTALDAVLNLDTIDESSPNLENALRLLKHGMQLTPDEKLNKRIAFIEKIYGNLSHKISTQPTQADSQGYIEAKRILNGIISATPQNHVTSSEEDRLTKIRLLADDSLFVTTIQVFLSDANTISAILYDEFSVREKDPLLSDLYRQLSATSDLSDVFVNADCIEENKHSILLAELKQMVSYLLNPFAFRHLIPSGDSTTDITNFSTDNFLIRQVNEASAALSTSSDHGISMLERHPLRNPAAIIAMLKDRFRMFSDSPSEIKHFICEAKEWISLFNSSDQSIDHGRSYPAAMTDLIAYQHGADLDNSESPDSNLRARKTPGLIHLLEHINDDDFLVSLVNRPKLQEFSVFEAGDFADNSSVVSSRLSPSLF